MVQEFTIWLKKVRQPFLFDSNARVLNGRLQYVLVLLGVFKTKNHINLAVSYVVFNWVLEYVEYYQSIESPVAVKRTVFRKTYFMNLYFQILVLDDRQKGLLNLNYMLFRVCFQILLNLQEPLIILHAVYLIGGVKVENLSRVQNLIL